MVDNPANHILVKNADEFAALLLRRSYQLEEHKDEHGMLYKIRSGDTTRQTEYGLGESFFLYESVATVADRLDRVIGQHHIACAQCGEPLLQERTQKRMQQWLYSPAQSVSATYARYEWNEPSVAYRAAKAGSGSPELSECPGCHGRLSKETAKEIED